MTSRVLSTKTIVARLRSPVRMESPRQTSRFAVAGTNVAADAVLCSTARSMWRTRALGSGHCACAVDGEAHQKIQPQAQTRA